MLSDTQEQVAATARDSEATQETELDSDEEFDAT